MTGSADRSVAGADGADAADELSDRQVEVLVYRVLAAVIAFLIAAGAAVLLNSGDTTSDDQQVGSPASVSASVHLASDGAVR